MKKLWTHPFIVAASNILLILVLYTLMRLMCYTVNITMFPDVSRKHLYEMLTGGLRFDLTTVLYLSSLYLAGMLLPLPARLRNDKIYQCVLNYLFLIPNTLGIIVNCADIAYIPFNDRRTTCTFFSEFSNDNNLLKIIGQGLTDYWYVVLFTLVILLLLFLLTRYKSYVNATSKVRYYVCESLLLIVSAYMVVIGIRGGFGRYTRPITISNAMQYTNTPRESALILNTPFSLMKSIENTVYQVPQYFTSDELPQYMTPIHNIPDRVERTDNVVILILESFSKEYIGFYNRDLDNGAYTGYTPFLDSLLTHCVTYSYSYASGRKSIDAMPSILSSIPMLIEPYIVTPYSTNNISSLAERLQRKGYTTAFFHGAPNGSMGFQAYARTAGFDAYYGKTQYEQWAKNQDDNRYREAFDGTWAIWDEEFLQYYAESMNTLPQPFLTSVFTASSHHPFRIPVRYEGVFNTGTHPIHQTIGYSDYALRCFFESAKNTPWYNNTLFVITADHTNQLTYPEYNNARGLYEIPVAFYHPAWKEGSVCETAAVSQTDILPSVLAYLGYDEQYFAFGEDALTQKKKHPYAVCYNAPVFQIFSDSLLLQFDGQQTIAVYDYRNDRQLCHNIVSDIPEERILPLENYLKAYIQQYIYRMINNQLTIE